jgi:hypothetical protein
MTPLPVNPDGTYNWQIQEIDGFRRSIVRRRVERYT